MTPFRVQGVLCRSKEREKGGEQKDCPKRRDFSLTKPFFVLIGLVMFFNFANLDTKLMVAILGQDCSLVIQPFSISHPVFSLPTLV